jgi:hypothetical protein
MGDKSGATGNVLESQIQSKAFINLWNSRPELRRRVFSINNNSQNRIKGAINKAMGTVDGVSDMAYLIQGSVVWIEWKTQTGTQKPPQKEFQKLVETMGMLYVIVRSEEEFLAVINLYA